MRRQLPTHGRWTRADYQEFETQWLSERIGHVFNGTPSRCTHCGRKYGRNAGRICPNRKRPHRWRLHCDRALSRLRDTRSAPVRDATWLLGQMREIERLAHRRPYDSSKGCVVTMPDDESYWKFSRDARRYRRYFAAWWALPASQTSLAGVTDRIGRGCNWEAQFTRGRNRLIKQAREQQVCTIREGGCTYTFYPDATIIDARGYRVALFADETE